MILARYIGIILNCHTLRCHPGMPHYNSSLTWAVRKNDNARITALEAALAPRRHRTVAAASVDAPGSPNATEAPAAGALSARSILPQSLSFLSLQPLPLRH